MANFTAKDAAGTTQNYKSTGAGSSGDPFIPEHLESNSAAIKTAVELIDDAVATGGSAAPAKGYMMMGSDGANARAMKMDSNGRPSVDVNSLPALPAGSNVIGAVVGKSVVVSATFARPADTNAYAALDAVSNSTSAPTVLTFTNIARIAQGGGYITKARLFTDQSTNTARFRLHLFHTAPTAINDNAAYTLLWANRANRIGHIDFDPLATEGSGSDAASALNAILRLAFNCAAADQNIYGLLQTKDIFTPASAQNFYIELTADQN